MAHSIAEESPGLAVNVIRGSELLARMAPKHVGRPGVEIVAPVPQRCPKRRVNEDQSLYTTLSMSLGATGGYESAPTIFQSGSFSSGGSRFT